MVKDLVRIKASNEDTEDMWMVLWGWAQRVKMFMSHTNAHQNPCPEQ